jgi:hypothetical protein
MGAAGAGKLGKQGAAGDGELQPPSRQLLVLPCTRQQTEVPTKVKRAMAWLLALT